MDTIKKYCCDQLEKQFSTFYQMALKYKNEKEYNQSIQVLKSLMKFYQIYYLLTFSSFSSQIEFLMKAINNIKGNAPSYVQDIQVILQFVRMMSILKPKDNKPKRLKTRSKSQIQIQKEISQLPEESKNGIKQFDTKEQDKSIHLGGNDPNDPKSSIVNDMNVLNSISISAAPKNGILNRYQSWLKETVKTAVQGNNDEESLTELKARESNLLKKRKKKRRYANKTVKAPEVKELLNLRHEVCSEKTIQQEFNSLTICSEKSEEDSN